jgi:hypothetical protein
MAVVTEAPNKQEMLALLIDLENSIPKLRTKIKAGNFKTLDYEGMVVVDDEYFSASIKSDRINISITRR